MENSLAYKWVVIFFFGIVGIMFAGSIAYLAAGNVAPDTYWGRKMTPPESNNAVTRLSFDKHVLQLDQKQQIGNRVFTYKGRQDDSIRFEVIIPELDPQYPYSFKVDLDTTNNGFEVAGIWFQLITVRRHFVSLKASI